VSGEAEGVGGRGRGRGRGRGEGGREGGRDGEKRWVAGGGRMVVGW